MWPKAVLVAPAAALAVLAALPVVLPAECLLAALVVLAALPAVLLLVALAVPEVPAAVCPK